MKRRAFVGTVGRLAAAALVPGLVPARGQPFLGWAWAHGDDATDDAEWRRRFDRVRAAGITGVLVIDGEVDRLARAAHDAGLAFHRWIRVLLRSGDTWVKTNHPEWFSINRDGASSLTHPPYVGYYQWLCPTREPVRAYLRGILAEVAAHPAVDGVHLDYIRHPDVILPVGLWARYNLVQDRELPQFDFCYCAVCREAFRRQTGRDPLMLADPSADEDWREFRWRSVTGVVEELARAVRAAGKPITAAVFPTPALARRLVRQAWEQWPLDAVFPMLYHRFYEEDLAWIGESVRAGVAALPAREPMYAGLYLPDLPPDELDTAVRIARAAGAGGVALFEMGGLTDAHLSRLGDVLRG